MRDILAHIDRTTNDCEQIVTKLKKALQKKGNNKTELDSLREDLNNFLNVIQNLQTAFISFVTRSRK